MSTQGRFTMLGSGGSTGVPVIGCDCRVCTSNDPHNKRTRPAALIDINDTKLLIDVGPDFRDQALREKIKHIDGLLLTHTHADHTAGMDDLRIFFFMHHEPVSCLLSDESLTDLQTRFHYLFRQRAHGGNFTAQMNFHVLPADSGEIEFEGIQIRYMSYRQGSMKVTGYRFGDLAYLTDIYEYDVSIYEHLKGVRTLIISALRFTPSHVHFTVQQAVAFAKEVGAERTFFTHMAHDLDHEETNALLPEGIRLGYDGLAVDFSYP